MTVEQYKNLWNYFLTLEQDLQNTSKFVEHCEDNFKTEPVESKEDCMKIIRENLGEEFAAKAKEIIEFKPRVPKELEDAITDLKKTRNKIDDVIEYLREWKRDILEPE